MKRAFVTGIKLPRINIAIIIVFTLIASTAPACKKDQSLAKKEPSPTTTFEAFYESLKNKDIEGYKKTVSKKTLEMLERGAEDMGKTLDEYIKLDMDKPTRTLPDKLEMRNEKIEGNHATLEIKNNEGGWNTVPFVKEDGQWKVSVEQI